MPAGDSFPMGEDWPGVPDRASESASTSERRKSAAAPRRTAPARTNAAAGAKTGQTQHCAGALFTIL